MANLYFITHPEVIIEKDKEITEWELSEKGLRRWEKMLKQPWVSNIKVIYSSLEQKAKMAAEELAGNLGLKVNYREDLGEMDRSSTGFLEFEEFTKTVEQFYSNPGSSIRGWERALDAQGRIAHAIEKIIGESEPQGDIAVVSHGGVGALLLCHLKQISISASEDQPSQGYYFVFDTQTRKLEHGWKTIGEMV